MAFAPLVSLTPSVDLFLATTSFSFVGSSVYFFGPTFSSVCLRVTTFESNTLLGGTFGSLVMSYAMSGVSSAFTPMATSVQHAPTTARLSRVVFAVPVFPMTSAYMPPRGSVSRPGYAAHASSPCFSPGETVTPDSLTFSVNELQCSIGNAFSQVLTFAEYSASQVYSKIAF